MRCVLVICLGICLIQLCNGATSNSSSSFNIGSRMVSAVKKAFNQYMINVLESIREDQSGEMPPELERAALIITEAAETNNIDYSRVFGSLFQLPFMPPEGQFRTFLGLLRPATPVVAAPAAPGTAGAVAAAASPTRDAFSQAVEVIMGMFSNPQFGTIMNQMITNLPSMFNTIRELFEGIFSGDS